MAPGHSRQLGQAELPDAVHVRVSGSAADDFRDRLTLLLENAGLAVVIVLGILVTGVGLWRLLVP